VLAIDYGTIKTGLAWMLVNGAGEPKLETLRVFREWPGGESTLVPSAISYSKSKTGKLQWGHDIDGDSQVLRWTKLEFQQQSKLIELRLLRDTVRGLRIMSAFRADELAGAHQETPHYLCLNAEDIVTDFLRKVARKWLEFMQADSSVLLNFPIDLVITHPIEWSYEAQNKMVRAVLKAFSRDYFPTLRNVSLYNESEACAIYTSFTATARDRCRLEVGDCFVVCDAGVRTVDLLSYETKSKNPFEIAPLTFPASVYAGELQIDRAYLQYLSTIIDGVDDHPCDLRVDSHHVLGPISENLLRRFIPVKRGFGSERGRCQIPLPRGCATKPCPEAQAKVKNRTLLLTDDDIEGIFRPSVDEILNHIAKQVAQVKAKRKEVTHVFMSGEFSDSPYLFKKVQDWARMKAIEVERGDEICAAVVSGAVLMGAGLVSSQLPVIRVCPRSYGITLFQKVAAYMPHGESDKFRDKLHGHTMAKNQIVWLVRKGDLIPADGAITAEYSLICNFTSSDARAKKYMRVSLVASTIEDTATRLADLNPGAEEVIHLDYNCSSIPNSERIKQKKSNSMFYSYYGAPTKVELVVDSRVSMKVLCGGQVMVQNETSL
jgi:hypothetical protein